MKSLITLVLVVLAGLFAGCSQASQPSPLIKPTTPYDGTYAAITASDAATVGATLAITGTNLVDPNAIKQVVSAGRVQWLAGTLFESTVPLQLSQEDAAAGVLDPKAITRQQVIDADAKLRADLAGLLAACNSVK